MSISPPYQTIGNLMIVFRKEYGEYELPIPLEELYRRFPNTSFCTPITQAALPENYFLAIPKAKPNDRSKKWEPEISFGNLSLEINWVAREYNEDEVDEIKKDVIKEIEKRFKDTSWAVADDVPEEISNKYKEYRSKLWKVKDQLGFPFSITYPEIE